MISFFFDSGLLVLIWIVQLIIYPNFKHYTLEDLKKWHPSYTQRIALVVIPLMFGQLIFGIYELLNAITLLSVVKIILISLVWILTFTIFVPLHNAIDKSNNAENITVKLVQKNWSRTIIWTLIFLIGLVASIKPYLF